MGFPLIIELQAKFEGILSAIIWVRVEELGTIQEEEQVGLRAVMKINVASRRISFRNSRTKRLRVVVY